MRATPFLMSTLVLAATANLTAQSSLPLPNAVVHDPTPGVDASDARIYLWYHWPDLFFEKTWSGATGSWSPFPVLRTPPSSVPATGSMPMVAWTDRWGQRRVNGFYKGDRYKIDTPWRSGPNLQIGQFTASFLGWFNPMAAFAWKNGTVGRLNMFGATNATNSIDEAWWDGSAWRHSRVTTPAGIGPMKMGPHSAIWMPAFFKQGFVYMLRDQYDVYSHLFCYRWVNNQWVWYQIDKPEGCYKLRGVPFTVRTGVMSHSVFVVAEMAGGQHVLYERSFFGLLWGSEWIRHGYPSYRHGSGSSTPVRSFSMTSGVAYFGEDGQRQVRLFGYSPATNGLQGRLFERHIYPSGWGGWYRHGVPTGNFFRTESSVVVDGTTWDTVHVFGRASDGVVWRRTTSERNSGGNHTTTGWSWTRMH